MRTHKLVICFAILGTLSGSSFGAGDAEPSGSKRQVPTTPKIEFTMGRSASPSSMIPTTPGSSRRIYDKRKHFFFLTMFVQGGPGLSTAVMDNITDRVPQEKLGAFRIPAKLRESIVFIRSGGGARQGSVEDYGYKVGLAAATVEEVEEQARELLDTASAWWKENREAYISGKLARAKKKLKQVSGGLLEKKKAKEEYEAVLGDIEHLDADRSGDIQTRLLFLDVDTVGVKARIDTAHKFLERLPEKTAPDRRKSVELIRIAAQVDLAGLLAQRRRIHEIIEADKRFSKFSPAYWRAYNAVKQWEMVVKKLEDALRVDYKLFRPIGKAVIQSIDWSNH